VSVIVLKRNYAVQTEETDRCYITLGTCCPYLFCYYVYVIILSNSFSSFLFIPDVLLHSRHFPLENGEKGCFYFLWRDENSSHAYAAPPPECQLFAYNIIRGAPATGGSQPRAHIPVHTDRHNAPVWGGCPPFQNQYLAPYRPWFSLSPAWKSSPRIIFSPTRSPPLHHRGSYNNVGIQYNSITHGTPSKTKASDFRIIQLFVSKSEVYIITL